MYATHFGLGKAPFAIAPDPRFLYMSVQHREALAHLLYGLQGGGGFVLLTGSIGAGKTTVCRCFLEQLPAACTAAYVFNPKLTATELLQTVCSEFGLVVQAGSEASIKALVDGLNAWLLQQHACGRQALLVIDEAQSLSADVLEQLRLLTNLETAERKLLQIVLIGQPELRDLLARPGLEQLAQRVIARYHLQALAAPETEAYIRHRLAVAGHDRGLPFDGPALARIHRLSGGVPRRINLLADRALLGAYARQRSRVDRATVEQAAREVFGARQGAASAQRRVRQAGLAVVLLGAGLALGWQAAQRFDPAAAAVLAWVTAAARVPAAASTASAAGAAAASVASVASAASAPTPATTAASQQVLDADALWAAATPTLATAWRELALQWQLAVGEGEPCAALSQAGLVCWRGADATLALWRGLDRPVLALLRRGSATAYVVWLGQQGDQALVQLAGQTRSVSLDALATLWRGELLTLWRPPPAWSGASGPSSAAMQAWLGRQLGASPAPASGTPVGSALAARLKAFQLAQGLPVDGVAGPLTLMALARHRQGRDAGGGRDGRAADEPRLLLSP